MNHREHDFHRHQPKAYVDGNTGEIFARCDCGREGPRLPGPTLPMSISNYAAQITTTGAEAIKKFPMED
jgi:hypothetical protein